MKKRYFKRSRISDKKLRQLIKLFISGEKISLTADKLNLEQKTVKEIFVKLRKRLEIDCWERIKSNHSDIDTSIYPFEILKPQLRIKHEKIQEDALYPPGIAVLVFFDDTVATNCILTPRRSHIINKYSNVNEEDLLAKKELQVLLDGPYKRLNITGYFFADIWFDPIIGYIESEETANQPPLSNDFLEDYMKPFLKYARMRTSNVWRTNLQSFYLYLKEMEWFYNNTLIELEKTGLKEDFIFALINLELTDQEEVKIIEKQIREMENKLYLKILEILRRQLKSEKETNNSDNPNIN
jgi:hypothetical protein